METEKLPSQFAIQDVEVWTPRGSAPHQDVVVENGRLSRLLPTGSQPLPARVFSGKGSVLLPSGVDAQVHLRTPGQPEKESPHTGLQAALRGGVAAVLAMPNTKPILDTPEAIALARSAVAAAEQETGVRVYWSAAMTRGQEGQVAVEAAALARAGVKALTDDGHGVARDTVMREVFRANAAAGLPLLQHAEVPGHGCALAAGQTQKKLGLPAYPAEAEWKMVERDIALLREFPEQRYHVLHVSSRKTVEVIRQARREGLKVTGEASPHHLLLTSDDVPENDTSYKMNPPLRSAEDRAALREALRVGDLEYVATDHAPHEAFLKGTDFRRAAFGTTGLEAFLRVLLKLVLEKELSVGRFVEVFSTAPARYLGLEPEFGDLAEGRPFRAVWLHSVDQPRPLLPEELLSQSKNSCFLGVPLPGHLQGHFLLDRFFNF